MTVLLRGFEKLAEMREERKRLRKEARAAGMAEGMAEGRAEGRAEGVAERNQEWEAWARQLIKEGKLPSEIQFPSGSDEAEK